MPHELSFWILAAIAAFVVGMSKGGLTSAGMLAVPILSLNAEMSPVMAAGLTLPIYIVSDWFGLWAFRKEFSLINVKIVVAGATIGILAGWLMARSVPPDWVRLVIGLIGLAFCLDRFFKRGTTPTPQGPSWPRGMFWGIIAGFTSFVSHSGGPPFQIYMIPQQLPKMSYAGTATIAFAAINMLKLPPYLALGQISLGEIRIIAMMAVVAVAGVFAGLRLTRVLPERIFYPLVTVLLFIVSAKLAFDGARAIF
jgi:uncharacterized membrane protein YfcA